MPSLVEMWFVTKPAKSLNDPIIIVTVFLSFPWTWQLFSCHSSKWGRLICKHCTVCYFTQQCYHTAGMQMAALFLERVLEKLETWEKNEIPYACITSIQLVQVQYLSVWAFCIWTIVQYDERIKKKSGGLLNMQCNSILLLLFLQPFSFFSSMCTAQRSNLFGWQRFAFSWSLILMIHFSIFSPACAFVMFSCENLLYSLTR